MTNWQKNRSGIALLGVVLAFALAAPAALAQTASTPPALGDASAKGALAVYKDFTKYPPDSRPLSTSNWDLLHPWSADSSSLPMVPQRIMRQVDALRASGVPEEEAWRSVGVPPVLHRYQFDLNKTILAGTQDELKAQLTITPAQGPAESLDAPVRIHVIKAELIGDEVFGSPHLGSVAFTCDTAAAVCAFHWKVPSAEKQFWGVVELVVTATLQGQADEFVMRQTFYSSPMIAGKFTGQFQEKIENGSLVIDAGVSVEKRMACFVSANLYSADREIPTHHAERRMIVDPSMKTIAFTFFGKIFRDQGHEGAFRLQDLKAQCENLAYPPEWFMDSIAHQEQLQEFQNNPPVTKEPSRIYFAYNNYKYTTRRYPGSIFSDQEWQSPEQARKLEAFKKAASELDNPAKEELKQQLRRQSK